MTLSELTKLAETMVQEGKSAEDCEVEVWDRSQPSPSGLGDYKPLELREVEYRPQDHSLRLGRWVEPPCDLP